MIHRHLAHFPVLAALGLVGALGLLDGCSCNQRDPGLGCISNDSCPGGSVCLATKCTTTCDSDLVCARGTHCDGSVCADGDRTSVPVIDTLDGATTRVCTMPAGTPQHYCIGTGIVANGTNLQGASWQLANTDPAGPSYSLMVKDPTSDTLAQLTPIFSGGVKDIVEGTYSLVATNAAGATTAAVQLLRGEKGPAGDPGVTGPKGAQGDQGVQGVQGVAGLAGGAAMSYVYSATAAGVISPTVVEEPLSGNRMRIESQAHSGNSFTVVAVDDTKLMDLCADSDGCAMTLGMTNVVDVAGYVQPIVWGPTCRIAMSPRDLGNKSTWSVGTACYSSYNSSGSVSAPVWKQTYVTDGYAIDNQVDGAFLLVASFNGACYFSDAQPDAASVAQTFLPDNDKGFFFFAAPPAFTSTLGASNPYPAALWAWPGDASASGRKCILMIED